MPVPKLQAASLLQKICTLPTGQPVLPYGGLLTPNPLGDDVNGGVDLQRYRTRDQELQWRDVAIASALELVARRMTTTWGTNIPFIKNRGISAAATKNSVIFIGSGTSSASAQFRDNILQAGNYILNPGSVQIQIYQTNQPFPQPPAITQNPQSTSIAYNASATLSVTASGPNLSYQWYVGNSGNTASPISGATSASYNTGNLLFNENYWVQVSNVYGSVNSTTAAVTVGPPPPMPPTITQNPQSQSIPYDSGVILTVTATGSSPLSYQWYVGNSGNKASPISGATSASYNTGNLTSTTSYWVQVNNTYGSVNSTTATITPTFAGVLVVSPNTTYVFTNPVPNTSNLFYYVSPSTITVTLNGYSGTATIFGIGSTVNFSGSFSQTGNVLTISTIFAPRANTTIAGNIVSTNSSGQIIAETSFSFILA